MAKCSRGKRGNKLGVNNSFNRSRICVSGDATANFIAGYARETDN